MINNFFLVLTLTILSPLIIHCREIGDNLFESLLQRIDDIDADYLSANDRIFIKNKRYDKGDYSFSGQDDSSSSSNVDDGEPWLGRWLPDKVEPKKHKIVSKRLNDSFHQDHLIPMSSSVNSECDDGKTNLTVDWSGSPDNYTCYKRTYFLPDPTIAAFITHDYIPTEYSARHVCMKEHIHYDTNLPTFGPHRPAWARFGEYEFLPVQRWLHNLEHGAIVMLYHPCAHPLLVSKLRDIVTSCLYRHVITPYALLPEKRPLAVVSWGWAMMMSDVDQHNVEKFIKEHALHGPEQISEDGQFDYLLKKPADIVTNFEDESVCPDSIPFHM